MFLNAVQYKCPYCGGELVFKPQQQKFGCDYCGSYFEHEEISKMYEEVNKMAEENADPNAQTIKDEKDFADIDYDNEFAEHTNLYTCDSCGAQIIADDTTSASFCYYCHNPVVLAGRLTGKYRPKFVIPFAVTREKAEADFKEWCKKKWFLPSDFKSKQQLEKMSGVYVPFWLTSCTAEVNFSCIGEKRREWTSGDYSITEISEFAVKRKGEIPFERVPTDGANKIENSLMDAIEPYNYKEMRDFSMQYLSGFMAEKYDLDWEQVLDRAKLRINEGCKQKVHETIVGYSSTKAENMNVYYKKVDREYVLMPVWFMTYQHNGNTYSFAMNAQTGKLAGTPPLSKAKLFGFCEGLFAVIAIIITIIGGMLS